MLQNALLLLTLILLLILIALVGTRWFNQF